MDQEKFDRFVKCAVDTLSVDASKVTPEASFADDLDADSLDLVELVMALEEEFGVEVPEEDLEGITTVGAAFNLVRVIGLPLLAMALLRPAVSANSSIGKDCLVLGFPDVKQ
jgi:acyl carrier protein